MFISDKGVVLGSVVQFSLFVVYTFGASTKTTKTRSGQTTDKPSVKSIEINNRFFNDFMTSCQIGLR